MALTGALGIAPKMGLSTGLTTSYCVDSCGEPQYFVFIASLSVDRDAFH